MQIRPDGGQISPLSVYRKQTELAQQEKPREAAAAPESRGDRVSLSDDARIMAEAKRTAQETSDIRQDKVAELKAQVESGTYTVDSRKVAAAMLREDMAIFGQE